MKSNVTNLDYRISLFDDLGRQILFNVKGDRSNGEYALKLADGVILDTDGASRIQTLNFDKIRRLQIGFSDQSILANPTNTVELSIDDAYLGKDKRQNF